MRDYLRCVYANKVSFVCYVFSALMFGAAFTGFAKTTPLLALWKHEAAIIGVSLFLLNSLTSFGLETYNAYLSAKKDIQSGRINKLASRRARSLYCSRVGLDLAKKEAGIE